MFRLLNMGSFEGEVGDLDCLSQQECEVAAEKSSCSLGSVIN